MNGGFLRGPPFLPILDECSHTLLIHTGGTLGMEPMGEPSSLAPGPSLDRILEQVPLPIGSCLSETSCLSAVP